MESSLNVNILRRIQVIWLSRSNVMKILFQRVVSEIEWSNQWLINYLSWLLHYKHYKLMSAIFTIDFYIANYYSINCVTDITFSFGISWILKFIVSPTVVLTVVFLDRMKLLRSLWTTKIVIFCSVDLFRIIFILPQ